MFEGVQPERPLQFGELRLIQRKTFVVCSEQFPRQLIVQFHQRCQRPGLANRRGQRGRTYAKQLSFDGQRLSIRIEFSKYHKVGVQIRTDAQHGGMAEARGRRQAVAIQFRGAPGVGVHLLPGGSKALNGQLFQTFAQPIETGPCAIIFEWKHQEDSLRPGDYRGAGGRGLRRGDCLNTRRRANCETCKQREGAIHRKNCNRARIPFTGNGYGQRAARRRRQCRSTMAASRRWAWAQESLALPEVSASRKRTGQSSSRSSIRSLLPWPCADR